jgi:phosphate transport system substrate-binding protein
VAARRGRCTNFGNCSAADSKQVIDVPDGADLVCPTCGHQLSEITPEVKGGRNRVLVTLTAIVLLALIGFSMKRFISAKGSPRPGSSSVRPVLRLHGSNTIGAKLAPALAAEFLRQQGASSVKITSGERPDESLVIGMLPGESSPKEIEVQAHGSATAFTDLGSSDADVGLSSRKIKPEEAQQLSRLGDMTGESSEHVLGLDGIAVVVARTNPVQALTIQQLTGIFSGRINDWGRVAGVSGPIKVYARDDKSGTFDTFKALVLGSAPLVEAAKRFEDSGALSDSVANDASAIGFVGLPYIRNAKAVAVSDAGSRALLPNRLTISTEDYALSRRLYLYTPANPQNPLTRQFVDFALSKGGQSVVAANGFVEQTVEKTSSRPEQNAPQRYKQLTAGAERLSLNFRFRTGSSELDNKARVDLDRVVGFLTDLKYSGQTIMLFGFADSIGGVESNQALSNARAKVVADEFSSRGVSPGAVTGFGSQLPVASNQTVEGREKNRRVEIWLRK